MFLVFQQSVGEACSNATADFSVSNKDLYSMDLNQTFREQNSVVGNNLETTTNFTKKDLLPLDVLEVNQNASENTDLWSRSQTTAEITPDTDLATTMQLDSAGKVNILLFFKNNNFKKLCKGHIPP